MSVTPMARFKEDFKSIKKILKENIEGFRDLSLNKVDPKWNYHKKEGSGYTKGVNSDFIRIFSLNKDLGIAFSFNDIDSKECYIFSSVKEKGKVVKSKDSFEETKKKVKEFISHLKTLSVLDECTDKKVKTVFTKVFLQEKIYSEEDNFENVLKKTQNKIDKILNNAQAKNIEERKLEEKKVSLKLKEKLEKAKKRHNLYELKMAYEEALAKYEKYEKKLESSEIAKNHEKSKEKIRQDEQSLNLKIVNIINKSLLNLPNRLKKQGKKRLEAYKDQIKENQRIKAIADL